MRTCEKESLWIQEQAFRLLNEIVSDPYYYVGANLLEEDRISKLLGIINALHAVIIESIQAGNHKRALRYLLALKKASEEIVVSRGNMDQAIEKRFRHFHSRNKEEKANIIDSEYM